MSNENHTKNARRGFYTPPVISTVGVCAVAAERMKGAVGQDRSLVGLTRVVTKQQRPLCLCRPTEQGVITVTRHSPAGKPPEVKWENWDFKLAGISRSHSKRLSSREVEQRTSLMVQIIIF